MNAMIRCLKGLAALGALAGLGLGLRWMTAGAVGAATIQDLTSMASLAVGAVAWVAYGWLLIAVLATVLEQAPGAVGRSASVVICWITSQGSRALLRSALGVAAATPLTIGVAHAAPGDGAPQLSVQRTWTAVEKASSIQLANTPDHWRATEKASTVHLTSQPQDVAPARLRVPDRPTEGAPTRYTDLRSGRESQDHEDRSRGPVRRLPLGARRRRTRSRRHRFSRRRSLAAVVRRQPRGDRPRSRPDSPRPGAPHPGSPRRPACAAYPSGEVT